jgi:hypothetical protein
MAAFFDATKRLRSDAVNVTSRKRHTVSTALMVALLAAAGCTGVEEVTFGFTVNDGNTFTLAPGGEISIGAVDSDPFVVQGVVDGPGPADNGDSLSFDVQGEGFTIVSHAAIAPVPANGHDDRTHMSITYEIVGCGAGRIVLTHSHAGEESSATARFDRPC